MYHFNKKSPKCPSTNNWLKKMWKIYIYALLCCTVLVAQSCLTLQPHGLQPIRHLCPCGFSRQEYWSGFPCPPPGHLPNPGIEPRSPTLQVDSLLTESPEKPKNTGVGSLSILQGIFPTQKSNWGLLHCRQSLYPLSNQGSPYIYISLSLNITQPSIIKDEILPLHCSNMDGPRDYYA